MRQAREAVNRELFALLVAGWAGISPVVATAQAQPDNDVVAPAAAPRAGRGESALNEDAPVPKPRPAAPTPQATVPAAAVSRVPSAPSAPEPPTAPEMKLKLWTMPPIRWGGYLAMDLRRVSAQGQPSQMQLVESLNINASSYLWQPWFAQISGDLNLSALQQRQGEASAGVSAATGAGTKSTSLSGNAQLALLPQSRFPFTASFSETDSRTGGELTLSPFTNRRYGLTQSYTPAQGGSSYRLSYNRSDITSDAVGTDIAKALDAGMNWNNGPNTLTINGNNYTNTRSTGGAASSLSSVYANHSYRPNPTFSVDSLANFSANQYHLGSADLPLDLRSRFLQLNSFVTWRPEENSPLTVNGGARAYQSNTSANGNTADTRTISANAGFNYTLNRNTRLNGGGSVTLSADGVGGSSVFTNQNAGLDYSSDAIKWGAYSYTWNSGVNLTNQTGGESSNRSLSAHIAQGLNRSIVLGEGSVLSLQVGQDYALFNDQLLARAQSLTHNARAYWSKSLGESATTGISLDIYDLRSTGFAQRYFQLINLQANGQVQFNRWSSFSANLTLQATRQADSPTFLMATGSTPADRFNTSAGGGLSYQHGRAFGVPRLRYYASLNLNQFQDRSRFRGDIDAPLERVNWEIEQRLDFDIGRLQTQLSLRVAETEHRINTMIFFRLMRQFGR